MSLALFCLAASLAATVVLGPLGLGLLQWRVSASSLNQLYGAGVVELLLVVPAALIAGWLWRRQHRLAPVLALGVAPYGLYVALQDVLYPDYSLYPGNNERFFPVFLALAILSWTVAVRACAALDPCPPLPSLWLRRSVAAVFLLLTATIGGTWTAQVLPIALTGALTPEYAEGPSGFWLIRLVDLGVIVPITLATALGLWRGQPLAIKAAYGLASFLTLELAAVLAMGAVMLWRQDPHASWMLVYVLAPVFLALATLTGRLLGSYAVGSPAGRAPPRPAIAPA